jgi:hypothetical protein
MKIINHNIPIITIIAPRKSAFSWFSLGGVAVFNPITPLWIFRVLSHHCLACVKIPVTEDALHFFNHPKPQMGLKKYSASYILYTLYIYINYNYIYIMYNMVYQFIISWITRNFTIFQTEIAILCFFSPRGAFQCHSVLHLDCVLLQLGEADHFANDMLI